MCDTCPDPAPSYCSDCRKTHWYHEKCDERKLREVEEEADYISNMIEYNYLMSHSENFTKYMEGFAEGHKCSLWSKDRNVLTGVEKNWAYKKYKESKIKVK